MWRTDFTGRPVRRAAQGLALWIGIPLALVGCQSGCDGERAAKAMQPRPIGEPAPGDAMASAGADATAGEGDHLAAGFLDVPEGGLDALFTGLAAAERRESGGRVLVAFFGDSHTAGDSLTSHLRTTWQARFGDGGRGLGAAGRPPTRHYYQRDVRYGTVGDWRAAVGGHHGDLEPFGIAGLRVSGQRKGAQLWVETCGDCTVGASVAQFEILYYAAPDHGALRYRIDDGAWQPLQTRTAPIEPPHPARQVIPVVDGHHRLTLEHAGGGAVDLFGVVLERARPGVIVDSLGVVGRRLGSLRSWDWSIIGEQLAARDPRLVVLQYGTNEADDPDLDLEALARYYDDTILRIRAAAPTAAILILGPPDVGVREAGKACDRPRAGKRSHAPQPTPPARPASPASTGAPGGPAAEPEEIPECAWRTPGVLREIISVEHAAAVRNRVAFFDTFAAMGGADRMGGWASAEPKIAYKDRVHFTDAGYLRWADVLSAALLEDYARWRRAAHLPPSASAVLPPPPARPSDAPLPGPIAP